MGFLIAGAVVFAAGCLFGAWLTLAGQASQRSRAGQRFHDAILKNLEKASSERENH